MSEERLSAGRLRGAAHALVQAWREAGAYDEHYRIVWEAKEYLHDLADALEAKP